MICRIATDHPAAQDVDTYYIFLNKCVYTFRRDTHRILQRHNVDLLHPDMEAVSCSQSRAKCERAAFDYHWATD